MMEQSFLALIEKAIKDYWDLDALTDYNGATLQYKDVARKIEKIHILFEHIGLKKGEKVALCGRNSSHWGVAFLATLSYGAVAVPILHEFKADNVHHIVNHSGARFLFVGDRVWENLNEQMMPNLDGIILLTDFSIIVSRNEALNYSREHLNEIFGHKFPKNFRPEHVSFHHDQPEELALINYTSGTTSSSKGVMLPYRSLWSNMVFAMEKIPFLHAGDRIVSILPMAHMFGMSFEFLFEFCVGCHIFFLTRTPSPKVITQAFSDVKPSLVITVPLVVEKMIKKNVLPQLEKPSIKMLLKLPVISAKVKEQICHKIIEGFGGEMKEMIIGGAPLNKDVERLLNSINFPYTVGYGMTECGPIITYEDWHTFKMFSCGRTAPRMEVRIDSPDPANVAGEIVCRGTNVMLGYYKNPDATAQAVDKDGWLHTGDLATMDEAGHVTIRGRSKNMLLGTNGQNIYPEEIEGQLNNMQYVSESIIIQRGDKLVALVYPDFDEAFANGLEEKDITAALEHNRQMLNANLPGYSQIAKVKIYNEEFEKTPKKSIKRYLYQNA